MMLHLIKLMKKLLSISDGEMQVKVNTLLSKVQKTTNQWEIFFTGLKNIAILVKYNMS